MSSIMCLAFILTLILLIAVDLEMRKCLYMLDSMEMEV